MGRPAENNGSCVRYARIVTLGCRLNQADGALLADRLGKLGFTLQPEDASEPPEVVILNSCAVTAMAVAKSRQAARKMRKLYPDAVIVFTGCAAELEHTGKTNDGFLYLSNLEKRDLAGELARLDRNRTVQRSMEARKETFFEKAQARFPFRTRAFIKIQEGCDNFCTYCIVPYTRGPSRSRSFDEVVADCRAAVEAGAPEVVLTGVNTCNYSDSGYDLEGLIDYLCDHVPGEWRLRLSSTEPALGNLRLLETMAKHPDRVCRFLHLALQHGADRILEKMHRKYSVADYRKFVEEARRLIPDIHLGTDVIVGFPGETEQDFEESYQLIESLEFANLHVFSYSPRAGTPAAELPDQLPEPVKKLRHQKLEALGQRMKEDFYRKMQGKTLPVIFETVDRAGMAHGWSDNYVAVARPADTVERSRIVMVRI